MKRLFTILLMAILIFAATIVSVSATTETTYKGLSEELRAKTLSTKTVKITWKKHKVDKYIIYKVTDKGEVKLKTVSGRKTSATIKAGKNEYLYLHVKGIKQKKNSRIRYDGNIICWTGVATPQWDDYLYAEVNCSPSSISIRFNSDGGLKPTGYQIYRREKGASKYKKIKTLKTSKRDVVWKDTSVKRGNSYYYKVRAFSKNGKKTYYSKKNESFCRQAVNFNGKYLVNTETNGDKLTIRLTSNVNNGQTVFKSNNLFTCVIQTEEGVSYRAKAYSLDGSNWSSLDSGKTITLGAGKSMWIQAERFTSDYYDEEVYPNELSAEVTYRDVPCRLDINIYANSASTYLDAEKIH